MMTAGIRASGPELEGFQWIRCLGSGGFADVHLYHQNVPSRDVAIKVVRSNSDSAGIAELRREADFMTAVAGHPAIVRLHGVGTIAGGQPYLVLEYYPVADLGEQVRKRPMLIDQALDVMIRICGGVEMLHRAGIVHRDIKPSNLMLDAYGSPVLADFGVASRVGDLNRGMLDGFSVLWAPPEQQDSRTRAHPSQDVWALASTTWTLLTGRSPFEDPLGNNSAPAVALRVKSQRPGALERADAPPELEAALRRAMNIDPVRRTPSALGFGRELQEIQRVMHRPITRMEIRDPDASGPGAPLLASTFSGSVGGGDPIGGEESPTSALNESFDAERTRLRAPTFDFQEIDVPEADQWRGGVAEPIRAEEPEDDEPLGRPVPMWAILLLVLAAAVVTAGLVVAMLSGSGRVTRIGGGEPIDPGAADPIAAPPAPVEALSGVVRDGTVFWTWRDAENGQSGSGSVGAAARYIYTASRPGTKDIVNSIVQNSVAIEALPGENCLEVSSVGEDGRQSSPVESCVTVP